MRPYRRYWGLLVGGDGAAVFHIHDGRPGHVTDAADAPSGVPTVPYIETYRRIIAISHEQKQDKAMSCDTLSYTDAVDGVEGADSFVPLTPFSPREAVSEIRSV